MTKLKFLKIILVLGAIYYLIGAIAHWFGLTIFPFFDKNLYAPYHDSVITLVAFIFFLLMLAVARDPVKNIDILKVVIISVAIASVFSILIIFKVDFTALGAPGKKLQTIVEGIVGFIYLGFLLYLYPHQKKL